MSASVTVHADEPAWLAHRRRHLTSSDIPPLFGVYPSNQAREYRNPYRIWLEKTGQLPTEEPEAMRLRFDLGRLVEPRIAQEVARQTGLALYDLGDYTTVTRDILSSTPDRVVCDRPPKTPEDAVEVAACAVEIKTDQSVAAAANFTESAKYDYALLQTHVAMLTLGVTEGCIAACFGLGLEFRVEPVTLSEPLAALIQERAEEFWSFVECGQPPSAKYLDDSEAVGRALATIYAKDDGSEVELDPESWPAKIRRYGEIGEEIKVLEDERQGIRNEAMAALGEATYGRIPGFEKRWSWKVQARKGYTVEPGESRVLRVVKA